MLRSGSAYRVVYRAAFVNGRETVAALTAPATFMAAAFDPLYAHLDRLPKLRSNQRILRYPTEGCRPRSRGGERGARTSCRGERSA